MRNDAEHAIEVSTKILELVDASDVMYWLAHQELGAVYLVILKDSRKQKRIFDTPSQ